jgi:hypothetical protein
VVGTTLALARRAGLGFNDGWVLTREAALKNRRGRDLDCWADVLDSTADAYADAYHRRSPLRKFGLHEFVH